MKVTRRQLRKYLLKQLLKESVIDLDVSDPEPGDYRVMSISSQDSNLKDNIIKAFITKAPGDTGQVGESLLENYILPVMLSSTSTPINNANSWAVSTVQPSASGFGINVESGIGGLGDSYAIDIWTGPDPGTASFPASTENAIFDIPGLGISMKYSMVTAAGSKNYQDPHLIDIDEVINAIGYVLGRYFKENPFNFIKNGNNISASAHVSSGINNRSTNKRINNNLRVHEFAWNALECAWEKNEKQPITVNVKFQAVNGSPAIVNIGGGNTVLTREQAQQVATSVGASAAGFEAKGITANQLSTFFDILGTNNPPASDTVADINNAIDFLVIPPGNKLLSTSRDNPDRIKALAKAGYQAMIDKIEAGIDLAFEFDATPEYTFSLAINNVLNNNIELIPSSTPASGMQKAAAGHSVKLVKLIVGQTKDLDVSFLGLLSTASKKAIPSFIAADQIRIEEDAKFIINLEDELAKQVLQASGRGIVSGAEYEAAKTLRAESQIVKKKEEFARLLALISLKIKKSPGAQSSLEDLDTVYAFAADSIVEGSSNIVEFLTVYLTEVQAYLNDVTLYGKGQLSPDNKTKILDMFRLLLDYMNKNRGFLSRYSIDLSDPITQCESLFVKTDLSDPNSDTILDTLLEFKIPQNLKSVDSVISGMQKLIELTFILGKMPIKTKSFYVLLISIINIPIDFAGKLNDYLSITDNPMSESKLYQKILLELLKYSK